MAVVSVSVILLGSCRNTPQFGKSPLDKVVRAMTIEEKADLLVGAPEGICQTCAIPRLGIPSVTLVSTGIPADEGMLLRTWNRDLAEQVGAYCAQTILDNGYDGILIPGFDSGNSTLSGMMAASSARGIQNQGAGTALLLDPGLDNAGMDILAMESEHWAAVVNDTVIPADWEFGGVVISTVSDNVIELSGHDMLIPGTQDLRDRLVRAINDGTVDMADVNESVTRILSMIEKRPEKGAPQDRQDCSALKRAIESEGMVLLKNNGVLPLESSVRKVALYGVCSYETIVREMTDAVTIEKGLENMGCKIDPAVAAQYRQFVRTDHSHIQPESLARQAFRYRADAIVDDIALITVGRSNEGGSLTDTELVLIKDVCESFHAKGKKVVLVLNTDVSVDTDGWASYPDAILFAGIPESDAGTVVTAILTGRINPSGRLAAQYGSYPFGHGLSYTDFSYSNATCRHENGKVSMSVTVTNTGKVSGKETVQVYVGAVPDARHPMRGELRTFAKTGQLQPGESQSLSFVLYDYYLPTAQGDYEIDFSSSSNNSRSSVVISF